MLNKTLKANASVTASARKISVLFGALIVFLMIGITAYRSVIKAPESEYEIQFIEFGAKRFQVEIADTDQKRIKGLGGRDGIADDEGMLFVFEESAKYCFWMKDVNFPLDIFWFNESYEIVETVREAQPESYPETNFCPDKPIKYVLEIKGGEAKSLKKPLELKIEHML